MNIALTSKTSKITIILLTLAAFSTLGASQTYNFDTCGASGHTGPSSCSYSGDNSVNVVGNGIQEWNVPSSGVYRITAAGARGGGSYYGSGAKMVGETGLNSGEVLSILVGQSGENSEGAGSGGGGTFVVESSDYASSTESDILVIAGGGGGRQYDNSGTQSYMHGTTSQSGQDLPNGNANGGTNGDGGGCWESSGGGGFSGNGDTCTYGENGDAFINGGLGGDPSTSSEGISGGFGGGATTHGNSGGGGGGGGYSGGAGGGHDDQDGNGGGGGSYIGISSVNQVTGSNSGDGYVTIEKVADAPVISEGATFVDTAENDLQVRATGQSSDGFNSCTVFFRDRDGNTFSESGSLDSSYGSSDETRCRHTVTNINSYTGFQAGEEIEYTVQFTDASGFDQKVNTTEEWHRNPNVYLKLDDSSNTAQSGVSVTAYQTETGTIASTGEDSTDECTGVTTDSNGWFSCGLAPNGDYDLKVNGIPRINDIDVDSEGTTRVLHYNQYDTGEFGDYEYLNLTAVNQTADRLSDANYSVRKAGTTKEFFMTEQNTDDGEIQVPLDQKEIYDVAIKTAKYQDDLLFRNVRVPDVIQAGFNQNFLPESTLANSLRFSAGHVLSAQTLVSRPFSNFDVVNVTVEKDLNTQFRLVSEVLVKQYNKTAGMTEACSVQPDSSTYFFIDEAECPLLDKINVSQDEWFRLDYRFRIPGPENFTSPDATNQYNVSDTIVRFDVL